MNVVCKYIHFPGNISCEKDVCTETVKLPDDYRKS